MSAPDIDPETQKQDAPSRADENPSSSSSDPPNGNKSSSAEELPSPAIMKEENGETESKPAAAGSVAVNGVKHSADVGTLKVEEDKRASLAAGDLDDEDDVNDDGQSVKSEGADEEDALFSTLEMKVEEEEAAHPMEQPSDATAAPKLLQAALKQGEVKMDDSEHGEAAAIEEEKKKGEAKEGDNGGDDHIHHRVSELFVPFHRGTAACLSASKSCHSDVVGIQIVNLAFTFSSRSNPHSLVNGSQNKTQTHSKANLTSCSRKRPSTVTLFPGIWKNCRRR
jgi:hypothetical protein